MYAVIKSGGKQHKVSEGEEILLEKISLDEGEVIEFSEVLAVNKDGNLNVGKPLLEGAIVKGKVLNHKICSDLSKENSLIFICGHYKGIDERVIKKYVDLEVSIGDFIISNGELSTMIIFDSIARLVPGVLNDLNSAMTDSFVDGLLDAPYFTRPDEIDGLKVPEVLLSGDHKAIEKWRSDKKFELTKDRRPDLLNEKESYD